MIPVSLQRDTGVALFVAASSSMVISAEIAIEDPAEEYRQVL